MQEPPIPDDEAKRLALLKACNIIYTPAEEAFDDVARLAADLCGTEIALITLVDSDYQWFKARVGVEQTGTPRDLSFCGHCINHRHPLVVEDTSTDPRFADPRADIWSMGVLLYQLLAGDTPFRGRDHLSLFANIMTKPPLPLGPQAKDGVPPSAEEVVLRCLRRPREERYQSMTDLAIDLRSVSAR